jgi:hypothetical protein
MKDLSFRMEIRRLCRHFFLGFLPEDLGCAFLGLGCAFLGLGSSLELFGGFSEVALSSLKSSFFPKRFPIVSFGEILLGFELIEQLFAGD